MNHIYADFAKDTKIENCFFVFLTTMSGQLSLDSIYNRNMDVDFGVILSYDESLLRSNFLIKHKKGVNLSRKNFSSIVKEIIKNREL